jgi:hypothetical protein
MLSFWPGVGLGVVGAVLLIRLRRFALRRR